jgi:transcriptional regulator with XRE-family HTH domain
MLSITKHAAPVLEGELGRNIRRIRKDRRLTLDDLAQLTGTSKGYLSAIENGKVAPSVASLVRISQALGVEVGTFFNTESAQQSFVIVRKGERKAVRRGGALRGLVYEFLAHPKANKIMEPFIIAVAPTRSRYALFEHPGQEFILVLEGILDFRYNDERHLLRAGDAAYFDASAPHGARAYRRTPAKVLSVICSVKG